MRAKRITPHVCAGQHIRTLILQAGTNSEFNHSYVSRETYKKRNRIVMFHVKHD